MFYKFSLTPVKASPGHSSCKGVGVDPDSVSRAMYTPHSWCQVKGGVQLMAPAILSAPFPPFPFRI